MRNIIFALMGLFLVQSVLANELDQMNRDLIKRYKSRDNTRERFGENQMPKRFKKGVDALQNLGIKIFYTTNQLSRSPSLKEVALQEYLRKQIDWGLPWLPMSWTTRLVHLEHSFISTSNNIESRIAQLSIPLSDDDLLVAGQFVGSIYHTSSKNVVEKIRNLADELGRADESHFWDIRNELHQEPSLLTMKKVEAYIQKTKNSTNRVQAEEILELLKTLFGSGSIEQFLKIYSVPLDARSIFHQYTSVLNIVKDSEGARQINRALDQYIKYIEDLAQVALLYSEKIRSNTYTDCKPSNELDCRYELFDLVRQLHTSAFAISNLMVSKIVQTDTPVSVSDIRNISLSLFRIGVATGLLTRSSLERLTKSDLAQAEEEVTSSGISAFTRLIETEVALSNKRVRGLYGPLFAVYKKVVPMAERYADDVLRSSIFLPLSTLVDFATRALNKITEDKLIINDEELTTIFRVLNTGIARGKLYFPSIEDLTNPDYYWDPTGLYILAKTPAHMGKVAGIITSDSGSSISHVQLLAKNHGLANVYVPEDVFPLLKNYIGESMTLIALPSGEARIKAKDFVTESEEMVYKEYNKIKDSKRVRLIEPQGLDINYPLFLEQLRMVDSGKIAGGKACGQGELAHLFPHTVPAGLVIPFGVYHEHMKNSGVLNLIEETFNDPEIKGSDEASSIKRKQALKTIREAISKVELSESLISFLTDVFNVKPFLENGVFVRSDTNAEDLPNFVGAGLNQTIPNVYGLENVIKSIKEVWGSPFREKAFTWRRDLIENPWTIYPSVIIQVAVSSTKAGVMVVGDKEKEDLFDNVHLAANEGIGITVVNGEYSAEEIIVSRKNSSIERTQRAYATSRKALGKKAQGGGIVEYPVLGINPLVSKEHALALAMMGGKFQDHMIEKYNRPEKWDIEWGMVDDKIVLFQTRPFIGNRVMKNMSSLNKLIDPSDQEKQTKILINKRLITIKEVINE